MIFILDGRAVLAPVAVLCHPNVSSLKTSRYVISGLCNGLLSEKALLVNEVPFLSLANTNLMLGYAGVPALGTISILNVRYLINILLPIR